MSLGENIGKIAIQFVPASIGAIVARKQLETSKNLPIPTV
jgi:uncharacterized membrane protein